MPAEASDRAAILVRVGTRLREWLDLARNAVTLTDATGLLGRGGVLGSVVACLAKRLPA